jgi:hypothetical protein
MVVPLSLAPRFSGVAGRAQESQPLQRFHELPEIAEAVPACHRGQITSLKQGVNGRFRSHASLLDLAISAPHLPAAKPEPLIAGQLL